MTDLCLSISAAALLGSALFGLGWWLLITTEGVYLGRPVVIWLYDLYANRYERIKGYHDRLEVRYLGRPLLDELAPIRNPLILDVATGTARLPRALYQTPSFQGRVIGVDLSRRMLHHAVRRVAEPMHYQRVYLLHLPAENLPFADATFEAVACLEALEFMMQPKQVIAELIRVTRPGGLLLLTNRKGYHAKLMPGKTWSVEQAQRLYSQGFGLEAVRVVPWQLDYDLVWARKPGDDVPRLARPLEDIWLCPHCHTPHMAPATDDSYQCAACGQSVPIGKDGVIEVMQA